MGISERLKTLKLFSLICLLRNGHAGLTNLARFPSWDFLHYPWVLSVVFKCFANIRITDQIAFLCSSYPERAYILAFLTFPPPPPPLFLEQPNLHCLHGGRVEGKASLFLSKVESVSSVLQGKVSNLILSPIASAISSTHNLN